MNRTLHLELRPDNGPAWTLARWWDSPNDRQTRKVLLPEIEHLLQIEALEYSFTQDIRADVVGKALYAWLNGGEGWLRGALKQCDGLNGTLVLAISVDQKLAFLPWETLHDGTRFLLESQNPPVAIARWRPTEATDATVTKNEPLQVLFMASSPEGVEPLLDYEAEEARILAAGEHAKVEVTVEESGHLPYLAQLLADFEDGTFDVLHVTGHADHGPTGPVFLLEKVDGTRDDVPPSEFVGKLRPRPRLVFLSGCRTGQGNAAKNVRAMAEQLLEGGFRSVLSWGKPVGDEHATKTAEVFYEQIGGGRDLATAVSETMRTMIAAKSPQWHLLRWFQSGEPPLAYVTPLKTAGRKLRQQTEPETEFLDPATNQHKVASRAQFVGRRKLLRESVRELQAPGGQKVGIHLSGFMGRGKSSVAARLCDRLKLSFDRVVVFGVLDEPKLLDKLLLPVVGPDFAAIREYVRKAPDTLEERLKYLLQKSGEAGRKPTLFVLDDFEQNQDGDRNLKGDAAPVLQALINAVRWGRRDRILLTGRYQLPSPFRESLLEHPVPAMTEGELRKLLNRVQAGVLPQERIDGQKLAAIRQVAAGNPRLYRTLVEVALDGTLALDALLEKLREKAEEFRGESAIVEIVTRMSDTARRLFGAMLLFDAPVPFDALSALGHATRTVLEEELRRAAAFTLVDVIPSERGDEFRVSPFVAGLVPEPDGEERAELARNVLAVLLPAWPTPTQDQGLTITTLHWFAGETEAATKSANFQVYQWATLSRYVEVFRLYKRVPDLFYGNRTLLRRLAEAQAHLGDGTGAEQTLRRAALVPGVDKEGTAALNSTLATQLHRSGNSVEAERVLREDVLPVYRELKAVREIAVTIAQIADILQQRGQSEEALKALREEVLPAFRELKDVRSIAITMGKIADILQQRGQTEEALKIRTEEELPVYRELKDVRSIAVTMGQIADILQQRGQTEEALKALQEEVLPAFRELKDVRSIAVTMGKIADILQQRGQTEEALKIRTEEQLPVYRELKDVREIAITMGKIADILQQRGQTEEALKIKVDEELPVYEELQDVRSLVVCRVNIAMLLLQRGREEDQPQIVENLTWAYREARARQYREADQIADIMRQVGFPQALIDGL